MARPAGLGLREVSIRHGNSPGLVIDATGVPVTLIRRPVSSGLKGSQKCQKRGPVGLTQSLESPPRKLRLAGMSANCFFQGRGAIVKKRAPKAETS